jgi:murein DD-endopeptidase MepM/ murein hydrolase activator NlpD
MPKHARELPAGRPHRTARFPRRWLLLVAIPLAAFAFAACSSGNAGDAESPIEAAVDPDTGQAVEETPEADPAGQIGPPSEDATLAADPLIFISPHTIRQGEAFVVAVDAPGAGFASVAFNGQILSLLREGSRFFTILGVDALTPPGPLPLIVSVADSAGTPVVQRETLITVTDAQWLIEVVELDESNSDLLDPLILAEDAAIRLPIQQVETPERHWNDIFDSPSTGVITSSYGFLRSYNQREPEEYHTGLDFGAENGAPVTAPNAGVIAWVGQTRRRGNGVLIDHGGGVFSGYYHMSEVFVEVGLVVNIGDFLGRVGATGLATGPHLHWEIIVHGITVDPVQWIRLRNFPDPLGEFDVSEAIQGPNQLNR